MGDDVNEAGERVERFGALELVLSETSSTGYKDTFFLKGRKKKPYQAKIWRPEHKDHINLGTFASAHAAAVEVAQYRRYVVASIKKTQTRAALKVRLPRPA